MYTIQLQGGKYFEMVHFKLGNVPSGNAPDNNFLSHPCFPACHQSHRTNPDMMHELPCFNSVTADIRDGLLAAV